MLGLRTLGIPCVRVVVYGLRSCGRSEVAIVASRQLVLLHRTRLTKITKSLKMFARTHQKSKKSYPFVLIK